jgi:phosphonate transport system permease protein
VRTFTESKGFLTLLLVAAFTWSIFTTDWGGPLVHPGGATSLGQFLGALFRPDFSLSFLGVALGASLQTIAYAVAGITLAVLIGFSLGVVASGVLARSTWGRRSSILIVRFFLAFLRSIHELVWAWLFVVAIGLSPVAAILALAIPYGGILGRIFAEILNDVPNEPLRALRSSGCSELKVFFYGRLPMALPDMLSYTFYRFECAIRAVVIMSFVGTGGLGLHLILSMNDLLYSKVWTLLFFLIILVVVVDIWSSAIRRRLAA